MARLGNLDLGMNEIFHYDEANNMLGPLWFPGDDSIRRFNASKSKEADRERLR